MPITSIVRRSAGDRLLGRDETPPTGAATESSPRPLVTEYGPNTTSSWTAQTGAEPTRAAGVRDVPGSGGRPRFPSGPRDAIHPGEIVPAFGHQASRAPRWPSAGRAPSARSDRSPALWASSPRLGAGPRLQVGGWSPRETVRALQLGSSWELLGSYGLREAERGRTNGDTGTT
jgi:hypothetical protein